MIKVLFVVCAVVCGVSQVIIFACIQLTSSSKGGGADVHMQELHQPEPVTISETGVQSSKVVRGAHQVRLAQNTITYRTRTRTHTNTHTHPHTCY